MCRYLAYLGAPVSLADLVFKPSNSLIHQAAEARESKTRINADGFGVGWYNPGVHPEPAVFKDLRPAWNEPNLRSLSEKVTSPCILAHVRAARRRDPVSRGNCHPFQYGRLLWMHNGDIPGRGRLHRRVCRFADDDLVARISGNTDSELAFVLFLTLLGKPLDRSTSTDALAEACRRTIEQLVEWWRMDGDSAPLALNFCVSDGSCIVASRFALGEADVPTLHACVGTRYNCEDGACRMRIESGRIDSAIVASEILSDDPHWISIENGQLVVIGPAANVDVRAIPDPATRQA